MKTTSVSERLASLRRSMNAHGYSAVIVTNNDPHSSEYSASHWLARNWVSGFTGSAGNAVVTADAGGVWTDGRYYIQAEEQLTGSSLSLFKAKESATPSIAQWLAQTLPAQSVVGVDGRSISAAFHQELISALTPKGIKLELKDLITANWQDRPSRPDTAIFDHELQFCGESIAEKLSRLRCYLNDKGSDGLLVSTLDDVMWTLNIRGGDTPYCPISESYLLLTADTCHLFIDRLKLNATLEKQLLEQGIVTLEYDNVADSINQLPHQAVMHYSATHTDSLLVSRIHSSLTLVDEPCIVTQMKAQKNATELRSMEHTLIQDGVAMTAFMYWLEQQVPGGQVTELAAEQTLQSFRKSIPLYISDSFRTIAGFAEHGAKMHYAADTASNALVDESNFFLVDSGGQYHGGTTDITRTFHFGTPTLQQRRDYTLVLKAVIRLTQAKFLKGTTGSNLDILARGILWQHGIDYKCGTGHGVGIGLNVHEGPQNFSQNLKEVALQTGMVITNEPGVYREGEYGVRIENIMKVVEVETNEFGEFYGFETITIAPIATNALELSMLDNTDKVWLNQYHQRVFQLLSPHLDTPLSQWLHVATQAI
ncbi:aminopeptidase P family protein [Vibrio nomapromontoriensis]|uniref:aminopeptidase P family protein n=1 Tax=Vibrio nomapromontoriensis TaxID=2910246 RepID=UPI003D10B729